jgi:hypothetical protein
MRDQDLALAAEDLNVIAGIFDLGNKILMSAPNILISLPESLLSSDEILVWAPNILVSLGESVLSSNEILV